MSLAKNLIYTPNIKFLTQEEYCEVNKKLFELFENQDLAEIAKISATYPLSAETLNMVKNTLGLDFLLRNNVNLANAIATYGDKWLEV